MQRVTTEWLMQPSLPDEALREIRRCAVAHRVRLTRHARERMQERNLNVRDIERALCDAHRCDSDGPGKWKLVGPSLDEDELVVVVVLDADVVVVTVFGR